MTDDDVTSRCVFMEQSGKPIVLGAQIGSGGEGDVFSVGDTEAVKLYRSPPPFEVSQKLRVLVDARSAVLGHGGRSIVAWPRALVTDRFGVVVGFTMLKANGASKVFEVYNPKMRRARHKTVTYQTLVSTAANLARAIAAIHARGYVVGDLNESNVLVDTTGRVTIIDADSFQVNGYRCPVSKAEYLAPEVQCLQDMHLRARTVNEDNFALAVLLYLILMEGTHPYQGAGEPSSLAERIRRGKFAGIPGATSRPPSAPNFGDLDVEVRRLFMSAFIGGHHSPEKRPSASRWNECLVSARDELTTCKVRGDRHVFFRGAPTEPTSCPWCRCAEARGGRDPFA